MKRALNMIFVLAIVSMFMVSPVAAATSQGLEWGVQFGDRFDFTMTSTDEDVPSEGLYVNITDMPALAIPDPLTDWNAIPQPDIDFWWQNGTSMGITALIFIGIFFVGGKFTLPIGNFTLLENLLAPELTGEDINTAGGLWTVEWSMDTTATEEAKITAAYSTSDGFLADYRIETWSTLNDTLLESIEVTRETIPGGGLDDILQLLEDNILYVGIGVAAIVIIGLVVCKRK
ncbi:hypothetical protein EU537_05115 [Candidatus Thorarchaeota archaeon]|nr:MAG: hypothetical protein EU537_05115 [Candidatus Thorarchaeota archaeon]